MSNSILGQKVVSAENPTADYLELMKEITYARYSNKEVADNVWDRFHTWIASTDFFRAPASTRFHGSFESGLVQHHLDVYNETVDLLTLPKFKDVNAVSAYLVALVHDFCKIGLYDPYFRNVKNDVTGQWEQVQAFKYDKPQYPFGHGVSSMYLANQFFRLTREESLAVRWHMGSYRCATEDFSELQDSNERYPLVLLLQFADQLSITAYESFKHVR